MVLLTLIIIIFMAYIFFKVAENSYYKSDDFMHIKNGITKYVCDCNELNEHIEKLRKTQIGTNQLDYGQSNYTDSSLWNYKRPELVKQKHGVNIYNCSRAVCDGSRKQPFKYICKYFNIKATEKSLENLEDVLNKLSAAKEGQEALVRQKDEIIASIQSDIPWYIKSFSKKRLAKELGFKEVDLVTPVFPSFVFNYVSSGGNASLKNEIVLDIPNLNRFIEYLSEIVKFKKSVQGQRALMTSQLRKKIKERDGYQCRLCGASITTEPNLLLEIDHIVPVSKGGLTVESNLQTLCWRCNRTKGAKTEESFASVIETSTDKNYKEKNTIHPNASNKTVQQSKSQNTFTIEEEYKRGTTNNNLNNVMDTNVEKEDASNQLIEYKELLDKGILTQEEYNELKDKLLKELLHG